MATSLGPKLTNILVNLWHPMNEKKKHIDALAIQ